MTDSGKMILTAVTTAVVLSIGWLTFRQTVSHAEEPIAVATPAIEEPSSAPPETVPLGENDTPQTHPEHWQQTFSDDFNGERWDPTHWIDSYPGGVRTHDNNEQQYYAPENVSVHGGNLTFTGRRENKMGKPYTSGMVSSYGLFSQKYGWFEIRARFPKGKGMWPAFWLLPANRHWPPEIDILEILGHQPETLYMSNHWGGNRGEHDHETQAFSGTDFSKGFHTVAVDWSPDHIIWYIDGKQRGATIRHIPEEPMFILANLAVGGDWPGMPDATTPFPGQMTIDYIRVYQRKP